MDLEWTVYVKRREHTEGVPLVTFRRPSAASATVSDFGLSIAEARQLLVELQHSVAQDQICAYDARRRSCRYCGAYRQIKDWRPRRIATALGEIRVRVPRVVSCLCLAEPLDDDDESIDLRYSECPIDRLVPRGRTPEVSYLCAKYGSSVSYRSASQVVADLTGLGTLCHATVRKETVRCGANIEDAQFEVGWFAGGTKRHGAKHLRVSIDGTVVTATPRDETSKFEVIAGRVERDGVMGRRFVCALPRRSLARVLVAAALEQSGWTANTVVDVVTDGAKGMRSLVTSVVPRVAPRILDWFHIAMKLRAVKAPLFARTYDYRIERPVFIIRYERLWRKIREALWRGRGDAAIAITRTLAASLREEAEVLPAFYARCADTASRAASALLDFLVKNLKDLVDYQRARMSGRRISSASAESVMNHLINRRMSKRQQMRWSVKGAHCLLQTRVELLDGRLEQHFAKRYPHFRSPERMAT